MGGEMISMYFKNPHNKSDMLVAIFNQQRSHMKVYAQIEDENGLLQTPDIPVNLQDKFGQARLKDFAWRITEEIGEALNDLYLDSNSRSYFEELSDVLHFLTEFTILAGYRPEDLIREPVNKKVDYLEELYNQTEIATKHLDFYWFTYNDIAFLVAEFIRELSMLCNLLKNKPWKRSVAQGKLKETDPFKFKKQLINVWEKFIHICLTSGIGPQNLYELYFHKSDKNKKRQETGY